MLELLLSYTTLAIAVFLFLGLVVLLVIKRSKLSKLQKLIIYFLCTVIIIYFIFIGALTSAFGNAPLLEPEPTFR